MHNNFWKKCFSVFVALLMIFSNAQNFVYAEGDDSSVATATVEHVQIKGEDGNWTDLQPDTPIKNGTQLRIVGSYQISNLVDDSKDLDKSIDLSASKYISIPNTDVHEISDSSLGSTWQIQDGKLNLHITQAYIHEHQNITGSFSINGTVSITDDNIKNGDKVTIVIGQKSTEIIFDDEKTESSLFSEKKAVGNIYKKDGKFYQNYNVNLFASNGDATLTKVTDVLGTQQKLSSKIDVKNTSTNTVVGSYNSFDEIHDLVIPAENNLTLSYTAEVIIPNASDLNNVDFTNVTSYGNQFRADYKTNENNDKTTNESSAHVEIKTPTYNKEGKYTNDGRITWTITIDLGSYKDLLSAYNGNLSSIVTDFKDTPGKGLTPSDISLADFKEDPKGSGIWKATYSTEINQDVNIEDGHTFNNDVSFKINNKDCNYHGEARVNPTSSLLTKEFLNTESDNTLVWKVSVKFKEGLTGFTLSDNPDYKSNVTYIAIENGQTIYDAEVDSSNLTEYGNSIISSWQHWNKQMEFKKTFVEANKNNTVNFICKTKLSGNPSATFRNNEEYVNGATLSYTVNGNTQTQTAEAKFKYVTNLFKTGTVNSKEDKIDYSLTLVINKDNNLKAGDVLTIEDSMNNDFVIDTKTKITGKYYNQSGNSDWIGNNVAEPNITYDSALHQFQYTIAQDFIDIVNANPEKKYNLIISYSAVPSDINEFYKNSSSISVQNEAHAFINGQDFGLATTITNIEHKDVVKKTGTNKNTDNTQNSYATYSVEINKFGVELNNGEKLIAVDELNSNLIYKLSSIQVKNLTTGEALSANSYSYSYNEEENSLTFTLPDSTPIKIEYKATVNLSNGSTMNESNSGNRFTVYGNSGNEINNSNASLSGEFNPNVTIQGEGAKLSIVKYDLDDVEKKLPGAEFSLVEATYDSDNNKIIESKSADDVKKGTTNAQGRLTFKNVRIDQIYVLKETKAPDGYEKVNDIYFVYPGNSFNDLKKPEANNEKYKLLQFSNKSMEYPIGDRKTTQETGKLTFTKSFSGVNENQVSGISFTVKNIDTNKVIGTYSLEHMKNTDGSYSKTLENLPVGKYTVTENNADVAGYTVVTTYKVNEKDSVNGTVEVGKDTENTVAVTNTYTQKFGSIKVTKTVAGLGENNGPESISFKVTKNDDPTFEERTLTVTRQEDGSYTEASTAKDLPFGTYTVTEENADVAGYTLSQTTYKVGETETNDNATVEVTDENEKTVSVTNTYAKDVGSLTFTKTFAGAELTEDQTAGISFTVTGPDEYNQTFALSDIHNEDGSYSKTLENLPVGKYTVTEINADVAGYTVVTSYKVNGNDSEKGTVEVGKDTENTVAVTNTYAKDVGSLTFTKTFAGAELTEDQTAEISFTVTGPDEYNQTFALSDIHNEDGSYSKTIENLPVGEYTVTENNADVTGYTVVTAYNVNGNDSEKGTVEVVKDTENTVAVTNTYTKLVSYTVKKVWNDGGVANVVFPESLDVTLTANGEKVADRDDATYVLNASNEWSYTWNELPENDANGNKINYSVVEANIDEFNSKSDLTIDEITGAGYITLTNTYSEGKTIEISKIDVGGNEIGGAILTLTDKNGEVISKWTSVVSENHKVTVKPGTYTLHEDLSPVGYKVAKDITFDVDIEGKVTVNGKKVDQVIMVDEDQTYDIAISKQDITNNKELPGAKLSLKDTKTNKVVETWTSASEAHVVTVVPSTYELSEVAAPNGYEIAEKITFTVERDGTITIDGKKVETVIMQDQPTKPTVDTSDHNNIVFYGFAGVISLGMALMMLLTRKKIH